MPGGDARLSPALLICSSTGIYFPEQGDLCKLADAVVDAYRVESRAIPSFKLADDVVDAQRIESRAIRR
jgi:hypothetical protein